MKGWGFGILFIDRRIVLNLIEETLDRPLLIATELIGLKEMSS